MIRGLRTGMSGLLLLAAAVFLPASSCTSLPRVGLVTGDALVLPAKPKLDGDIILDPAWRDIPPIPLGGKKNNTDFYKVGWLPGSNEYYFGVYSSTIPAGTTNRVVVGFVTHARSAWRIHIFPPDESGPPSRKPEVWGFATKKVKGASDWVPIKTPEWVAAGMQFKIAPDQSQKGEISRPWSLEFRIPIDADEMPEDHDGIAFPDAGIPYRMYVNVLSGANPAAGTQLPWPEDVKIEGKTLKVIPEVSEWGVKSQHSFGP